MKPAPFRYHAPTTVDEALALLEDLQDEDAKVLAGGQSLVPLLNMRLARPGHLVDINRLRELSYVNPTDDGGLAIGALARHRDLERSAEVAGRAPLLAEAAPLVGDRLIRIRGTVGGSLAHADPSAELPTVALALDGQFIVAARDGRRTIPAEDFFVTILTTALQADELLVEVRFPPQPARSGNAFLELARQHGDFAIVSAAAVLVGENGHFGDARICLGGVGPTPIRARRAEMALQGGAPGPELFAEAGRIAAEEADPTGDVHGTAEYRREMVAVYVARALEVAHARMGAAPA